MCFDEPLKFIFPCFIQNDDIDNDIIINKNNSKKYTSKSIQNNNSIDFIDKNVHFKPVSKNIKLTTPNSNILDLNYINYYTCNSNIIKK